MANNFVLVERWRAVWARGEFVNLPLRSTDMEPLVHSGDTLKFSEARLMDLRAGDFVLTYSQGSVRLRRLVRRYITDQGERFVIDAVNLPGSQKECGFDEILAKAESIIRGRITLWKRGESALMLRWRRYWNRRNLPQ